MPSVGVLNLEIHVEEAHSLKEKRHVVKSLKDRLRARFNVSVAEIDGQDSWQRAVVAVVTVSSDHQRAEAILQQVDNAAADILGGMLSASWIEWLSVILITVPDSCCQESVALEDETPHVHPDDPLDAAMQRMGQAGVEEIAVVSRVGSTRVGMLSSRDVIKTYRGLGRPDAAPATPAYVRNWLPAIATTAMAAFVIVAGLVLWQRSRRVEIGREAYESGERMASQGQFDDAVLSFRNALAQSPNDPKSRAELGLALVRLGHFSEASSYLRDVTKADPGNGPAWLGLAEAETAGGDKAEALKLYRKALSADWPAEREAARRVGQLEYAALLAESGKRGEAVSLLLAAIDQRGDDSAFGKKAAEMVKSIGPAPQGEEAYLALSVRFPADADVWISLGDARFAADRDAEALTAYRRAAELAPGDARASAAVQRASDVLELDPTRRGLSVRERARRWDAMLARVLSATGVCGNTPEGDHARQLLKRRGATIELSDQKMESALKLWQEAAPHCKQDVAVSHIIGKIRE